MSEQPPFITRVQLLMEAMENSSVGELDLPEGGTRIQIKRASAVQPTVLSAPAMPFPMFARGMLPAMPAAAPTGAANAAPPAGGAGKRPTRPAAADSGIAV